MTERKSVDPFSTFLSESEDLWQHSTRPQITGLALDVLRGLARSQPLASVAAGMGLTPDQRARVLSELRDLGLITGPGDSDESIELTASARDLVP